MIRGNFVLNKDTFLVVIIAVTILLTSTILIYSAASKKQISSYSECVRLGYPTLNTTPNECRGPDGKLFVEQNTTSQTSGGKNVCEGGVCKPQSCDTPLHC
jgi:hypothetical protein